MKIRKLDKRFRLFKMGLATHMAEMPVEDVGNIQQIMMEAYGVGQLVYKSQSNSLSTGDWFYTYNSKTIKEKQSTDIVGNIIYYDIKAITYRIYFRREEQATYLALKMT